MFHLSLELFFDRPSRVHATVDSPSSAADRRCLSVSRRRGDRHVCGVPSSDSRVTIDCQTALLLWFSGTRLEILADELTDVNDIKDLENFVLKHRKLLDYAVDVSDIMAYITLASSIACGTAAIMSGLQLCACR